MSSRRKHKQHIDRKRGLDYHCVFVALDLPQFPDEVSLVQSKVVSLIQLNQIEDAYNYILKNESFG